MEARQSFLLCTYLIIFATVLYQRLFAFVFYAIIQHSAHLISRFCTEIVAYCAAGSAPTLANANTPAPQTKIYATTQFTCNYGYASDGGATLPYYQCLANTSTTGQWSAVTYGCICMSLCCLLSSLLILLILSLSHPHWYVSICTHVTYYSSIRFNVLCTVCVQYW